MTSPAHNHSAEEPTPRRKTRSLRSWAAGGAIVLAALGLGYGVWQRATAPQPPVVETSHIDPEVAQALEAAATRVRQRPYSVTAWGELGMVLHAHEFYEHARSCYERAERLDARDPRWPYLQAVCWSKTDPEQALPCLQRASQLSGATTDTKLRLADALIEREQFDEAESVLRTLSMREPAYAHVAYGLGRIAFARGDLKTSLKYLEQSVGADTQIRAVHALLARVYEQLGDKDRAEKEWHSAAIVRAEQSRRDPLIDEVMTRAVGREALLKRAYDLWNAGEAAQSQALLVKGVLAHPSSAKLHAELGKVRVFENDLRGAEPELREALRLEPDLVMANFFLGMCLRLQARDAEATESLRKATRLQPEFAAAHFELGLSLAGLGDSAAAINAFRDAVRFKPDMAIAHKLLALTLLQAKKPAEALPHLRQAAALLPDDAQIKKALSEIEPLGKSRELQAPK